MPAKKTVKTEEKKVAKKTPAKKTATKKVVEEKPVEKKAAAPKKATTKKATAEKKPAAKKTAAPKKAATEKKPAAKKTTAKKTTTKKAAASKAGYKTVQDYKDIINWKKGEAHAWDWLYIEINAYDLLTEVEAGADNLDTACQAIKECLLEGDNYINKPAAEVSKDLTVRYYCDNLSEERGPYTE